MLLLLLTHYIIYIFIFLKRYHCVCLCVGMCTQLFLCSHNCRYGQLYCNSRNLHVKGVIFHRNAIKAWFYKVEQISSVWRLTTWSISRFRLQTTCFSSLCASLVFEAYKTPQNNKTQTRAPMPAVYTVTGAQRTEKQWQAWIYCIVSSDKAKPTLLSLIIIVLQLQGRQTFKRWRRPF